MTRLRGARGAWRAMGVALALALLPGMLCAQSSGPKGAILQSAATTGNGTDMEVSGYSIVAVLVTGVAAGADRVVTFRGSLDGTLFADINCRLMSASTLAVSQTASGTTPFHWSCPVAGLRKFRAVVSGGTTGAVTVTASALPNVSWLPPSAGEALGDALVSDPLSQFAATSSAQLAGVVNDETGTGLAVFNTSPALVTPQLTGATLVPPVTIAGSPSTGTVPPALTYTGAAHTALTASTERIDMNWNSARTVEWATGALTTQRFHLFQAPTLGFVGASTVTDTCTVCVTGAPVKGTNATLTQTHGLLIQAGAVSTAAAGYGLTVNAPTGATVNYAAQFLGSVILPTTTDSLLFGSAANGVRAKYSSTGVLAVRNAADSAGGSLLASTVTASAAVTLSAGSVTTSPSLSPTGWSALQVSNSVDNAAATLSFDAQRGRGASVPGRVDITAGALGTASGATVHTLVQRHTFNASKVLTNNSAISIVSATLANGSVHAGQYLYAVEVTDGTDVQIEEGIIACHVTNKAAAIANNTCIKSTNQQAMTAGTLTVTFAISAANPALISVNANSSLTPSAGYPRVTYEALNLTQQAFAIQ